MRKVSGLSELVQSQFNSQVPLRSYLLWFLIRESVEVPIGRGKEDEKQQESGNTDLFTLTDCWDSGSTDRYAALRWSKKVYLDLQMQIILPLHCSLFCLHKVSSYFYLRNCMCHFLDSPPSAAYFVPLLGLNIYFIILLLSCQFNMEGVWSSRLPCLVTVQSFLNDLKALKSVLYHPGWFPSKHFETVLCFFYLNCAKQTNK